MAAKDDRALPAFAQRIIEWQADAGRRDLPWQVPDPYKVWLSEVMLQQTQVQTVLGYFQRFITAFPTVADLARADEDQVLQLWAGLGYYARARRLHACAKDVVARFDGQFPSELDDLISLPGIGRSTAGAIRSLGFGLAAAILDGNVKRVLARHAAIVGVPDTTAVSRQLWLAAEQRLSGLASDPAVDSAIDADCVRVHEPSASYLSASAGAWVPARAYTQGMMDLGATLCTPRQPQCPRCPVAQDCAGRLRGLAERLPTPKPAKQQPLRHCALMLVQRADGAVLLQRRSSTGGIWSGLWCLPQVDQDGQTEALQALWQAFLTQIATPAQHDPVPIAAASLSRGAVIRHVFSHFKLDMTPVWVRLSDQARVGLDAITAAHQATPWAWVDARSLASYGLPAPVQKLLDKVLGSRDASTLPLI